jgi:CheY-like chemotaxis protein
VTKRITPADLSDPQELIARALALSAEFDASVAPGFEALVFKASRGIEDVYELTYLRKDGTRFPAVVSVAALRDAREAVIGYLLTGTDNTARKRVDEERKQALQRQNLDLVAARRMKAEFLANMSHELRTPLNAIIGFSEALKDGLMGEMTELQSGFVGDICTSGRQLLSLINDVLDLSGAEAGKASLDLAPVGPSSLFENSVSAVKEIAAALEAPADCPFALVVEDDLNSAALIRVMLEAEGFRVLHAVSAEAALDLAARQPIALITLDIMLPGMDGWAFLARIKDVPALRRVPVVIISIVADRRKGFSMGATAVMQKPVSRAELRDSLADLGFLPGAKGRPLTVLVVDDDPKAVELIAARMLDFATNVLRAYGGREAIAAARREIPDLIVLDLMMPKVNGFDVVEALHDTRETARIPILVVTSREITAEDRTRLNGSVSTIMDKGTFHPDRFTEEVRRAMSGRQAAA